MLETNHTNQWYRFQRGPVVSSAQVKDCTLRRSSLKQQLNVRKLSLRIQSWYRCRHALAVSLMSVHHLLHRVGCTRPGPTSGSLPSLVVVMATFPVDVDDDTINLPKTGLTSLGGGPLGGPTPSMIVHPATYLFCEFLLLSFSCRFLEIVMQYLRKYLMFLSPTWVGITKGNLQCKSLLVEAFKSPRLE